MADRSFFRPEDEAARILAAVVESSDDAIIVTDIDGIILTWNGGAAHLYGYDAAEMRGRSIAVLVPETHRSEFFALVARLKAGEGVSLSTDLACGIEGTVSTMCGPRCQGQKSRPLDATSRLSLVNYHCCERCGLVWKRPK